MPVWCLCLATCCLLVPVQGLGPVTSQDAALLAAVPDSLRCFSRTFEDLTCFWDQEDEQRQQQEEEEEEEEEEPRPEESYQLLFAYPGEAPRVCPLSVQRLAGGGVRYACRLPAEDAVRLFSPLRLWVRDPDGARNHTQRVLNIEAVGLPDPPRNIVATATCRRGELRVSWEATDVGFSEFLSHQIRYGPAGLSELAHPGVQYLDLGGENCVLLGLPSGTTYQLQLRSRPDGISLSGFWGPWSPPLAVELPQDAAEIGLQCFTRDLRSVTCQWQRRENATSVAAFCQDGGEGSCARVRDPVWERCEEERPAGPGTRPLPPSRCHLQPRNDSTIAVRVEMTLSPGTIRSYLSAPFWMHQAVLTDAPRLRWMEVSSGRLRLEWAAPPSWLAKQMRYQLRYTGENLSDWKVLEPPPGALEETLELRPWSRYRLQVRARPDGPSHRGPWSAWSVETLVETSPGGVWVSMVTTLSLVLGPGSLLVLLLLLRRLHPASYRSLRQTLWPSLPDLHRVLGGFFTETQTPASLPKAPDADAVTVIEEEEPCLLEVLSEVPETSRHPPGAPGPPPPQLDYTVLQPDRGCGDPCVEAWSLPHSWPLLRGDQAWGWGGPPLEAGLRPPTATLIANHCYLPLSRWELPPDPEEPGAF